MTGSSKGSGPGSGSRRTGAGKPAGSGSGTTKTGTKKTVVRKTGTKRPGAKTSGNKRPGSKKASSSNFGASKPAVAKPGGKPAAAKPAVVQSGLTRPGGEKLDGSPSGRGLKVRVKTAKRRSNSSARWLQRQLNDPYVVEARKRGYRSRAAFKLLQIEEKCGLLAKARRVVDLGAAPGGWTQVTLERAAKGCKVVGIDLLEIEPIPGAVLLVGDFLDEDAPGRLKAELDGPADVVLTDMAAATIGHVKTDHLRIMGLVETALQFALEILAPGGSFVAKVIQGGAEQSLLDTLKRNFTKVRHVKPAASRSDSAEMYLVATGFRGVAEES